MARINVNDIAAWLQVAQQLVALGMTSYSTIQRVMEDAGADEATIEALRPQWQELVTDVRRAADVTGGPGPGGYPPGA